MKQFIQNLGMAIIVVLAFVGGFATINFIAETAHGISGCCKGNEENGCEYFFCPYYGPRENQAPIWWRFKDNNNKLTDEAFSVPNSVK